MKPIGQTVGHTRSGKAIYVHWIDEDLKLPHQGNLDFTLDDQFDAYAVFEVLVVRSEKKYGEQSSERRYYQENLWLYSNLVLANFQELKLKAGCSDAFAIAELGRSLCNPEFKDF